MRWMPLSPARRHTIYNLLGASSELLLALVSVPVLLHGLGLKAYGILALINTLWNYAPSLDLGLGRILARDAARTEGLPKSLRSAIELGWVLGLAVGALFLGLGALLLARLDPEVRPSLVWIALAVPALFELRVIQGVLQGRERFVELNLLRLVTALLSQGLPLCLILLGHTELISIIAASAAARALALLFALGLLIREGPWPTGWAPLPLRYGAWMSLSNLIGPLLDTSDRFIIGLFLGASQVSFYTVPFSLARRLRLLPEAVASALFPKLARNPSRASKDTKTLVLPLFFISLLGILLEKPLLSLWIGKAFAQQAALVGELLLLGFWINSLAQVPLAKLQAEGHAEAPAKLHLWELPLFFTALVLVTPRFGIVGAAAVWVLRAGLDAGLLFVQAEVQISQALWLPGGTLCLAVLVTLLPSPWPFWGGFGTLLLSSAWALRSSSRRHLNRLG